MAQFVQRIDGFTQDFICGAIGGIGGLISGFFLDTVKVHMQMHPQQGAFNTIKNIYQKHGFLRFYSGIMFPLLTAPFIQAFTFSSYQLYKNLTGRNQLSLLAGFQSGAFAGVIVSFLIGPSQLIKCNMQIDKGKKYKNSADCLRKIIGEKGFKGLLKGVRPTAFRQIPSCGIQFATFQFLKSKFVSKDEQHMSILQALIVGPIAALCSQVFTYPQDVIKTHIQINPQNTYSRTRFINDEGIFNCARSIYKEKGVLGFTVGIFPCMGRALMSDGVCIAIYEMMQRTFTNLKKQ